MFRIDEGCDTARPLGVGNRVQRQSGLARRFRPVYFDDAAPRKPANAERDVERDRARRNDGDRCALVTSQAHYGSFAELPVDLRECGVKRFFAISC